MSASSRPAGPSRFRYSPLIAAFACAFSQASLAVPTPLAVSVSGDGGTGTLREQIITANACTNPDGYDIIVPPAPSGPFTVSVSSALPAITCPNVQIAGNDNITIQPLVASYGGVCGLEAQPASGRTRISGVTVSGFRAPGGRGGGSGMCGKLEATGNTVTGNDEGFTLNGGAIVTGNTITANPTWGIADTGTGSTISRNTIDGNGYGIYAANAMVVDDNDITNNTNKGIYGLDSMVITNNTITGNGWNGVDVFDSATITGNLIANNGTGIDAGAGAVIKGNIVRDHMVEGTGINLYDGGTIGGSGPGEGNVVYNNYVDIYVYSSTYGGALDIVNNRVGTADGVTPGTSRHGIDVLGQRGAYNITGNVIGGHGSSYGLRIDRATAAGTVSGNMIGVNASGTAALANLAGIELYGLSGRVTLSGNVISGNSSTGVDIWTSTGVVLDGNKIGSNASATAGIGNGSGVMVSSSSNNSFDSNVVAYNNGDGIRIESGTGNVIRGGSIHSNTGKNINLGFTGAPLPNDTPPSGPPDQDTGPNNLQNYPEIISAVLDSGDTVVQFTLQSTPLTAFDVQFYSNTDTGVRAGRTFVTGDVKRVITDASGMASDSITLAGSRANVTATATAVATDTRPSDGTSEFSAPIAPLLVPAVSVLPSSIAFGDVVVGATSPAREVTFTSTGTAAYIIDSMVSAASPPLCPGSGGVSLCASGDFSCATDCVPGTRYLPSAECRITGITFHPVLAGAQAATIYVCDNTSATARAIALSGTGILGSYRITPHSFDYGFVPVGSSSAPRTFILSNDGDHALPLSGVSTSGPFSIARNDCGASVRAHGSCSIDVTFAPVQEGRAAGTIRAQIDLAGAPPARASLAGNGIQQAALALPDAIDFGSVALGAAARLTQSLELRNTGNALLTFTASITSGPFTLSGDCGRELAPAQACTLVIAFSPATVGEFQGSLAIVSNAPGGSRAIRLIARVQPRPMPVIRVQPAFIGFGERMVGVPSAAHRVTLTNDGAMAAELGPLEAGADYIVSSRCGATLAPQGTCTADVLFRPVGFGPRPGRLQFTSNADDSPHSVDLLGTGCRPYFFGRRERPPCAP